VRTRKGARLALALTLILPLAALFAASVGSSGLGPLDLLQALGAKLGLGSSNLSEIDSRILLDVRLSRVLLSILVGGGLAASGVIFQGILLNPLADPYTVGVSSGAALGASVAILAGLGGYTAAGLGLLPLAAFTGAILALTLVHLLASARGYSGSGTLILAGIVVSTTLSAGISLLKSLNEESVSSIVFWIMGSLSGRGWGHAVFSLPYIVAGLCIAFWLGRDLDLLALGEDGARQMGVDSAKVRKLLLVSASVMTGACVAVSGVIGFVGLIVPHLVRTATGPSHRQLLLNSFLAGGILLSLADALSRTILPGGEEIPVGVVTALIGGPFFCWLLGRRSSGRALG
jgi:iron complex transport system permease protein